MACRYRRAVEIGFGGIADVALALQERGVEVSCGDTRRFSTEGLCVFVDDVTAPTLSFYGHAEVLYAVRPPLELVPYIWRVARTVSADMIIKPLSSEYPGGRPMGRGRGVFFIHDKETSPHSSPISL
jgi:uncharacterized UPF0146 family protein